MENIQEPRLQRDLDWIKQVITSSLSFPEFLTSQNPNIWFGKRPPVFIPAGALELLTQQVVFTKNTEPKTKNWKSLKKRVVQPALVKYQSSGVGDVSGYWTFKSSEAPQHIRCADLESILEPEGSVDFKRYRLTPKMLIYSLREAIQKRGAYIYSRRRKCEIPKRELWVMLKTLAPEDVNEISPGIYRLRKRKGSKGYQADDVKYPPTLAGAC